MVAAIPPGVVSVAHIAMPLVNCKDMADHWLSQAGLLKWLRFSVLVVCRVSPSCLEFNIATGNEGLSFISRPGVVKVQLVGRR